MSGLCRTFLSMQSLSQYFSARWFQSSKRTKVEAVRHYFIWHILLVKAHGLDWPLDSENGKIDSPFCYEVQKSHIRNECLHRRCDSLGALL